MRTVAATKREAPTTEKAWLYLLTAGLLEIVWASGLKYGLPGPVIIIALLITFDLLVDAAKRLPIGTAYAVFTAIGTIGTVIVEAVVSGGVRFGKVLLIGLLLLFIVGLKATTEGE